MALEWNPDTRRISPTALFQFHDLDIRDPPKPCSPMQSASRTRSSLPFRARLHPLPPQNIPRVPPAKISASPPPSDSIPRFPSIAFLREYLAPPCSESAFDWYPPETYNASKKITAKRKKDFAAFR